MRADHGAPTDRYPAADGGKQHADREADLIAEDDRLTAAADRLDVALKVNATSDRRAAQIALAEDLTRAAQPGAYVADDHR